MKTLADDRGIYWECLRTVALRQWDQELRKKLILKKMNIQSRETNDMQDKIIFPGEEKNIADIPPQ
ncbi:hypothetical protein [Janthinobacterium sp.]|uniref:hypothetical protein n=1 Tax=Janthinobacterium sp. TaxID=1871054 RepID=UPI002584537B|nr:hypothetical protein [Janthinobacterium sp.]MCX7291834.1 hypothetical protein [Janthinobacterium sp.]